MKFSNPLEEFGKKYQETKGALEEKWGNAPKLAKAALFTVCIPVIATVFTILATAFVTMVAFREGLKFLLDMLAAKAGITEKETKELFKDFSQMKGEIVDAVNNAAVNPLYNKTSDLASGTAKFVENIVTDSVEDLQKTLERPQQKIPSSEPQAIGAEIIQKTSSSSRGHGS